MIKINGVTIETPSDVTISIEDIVKADRNTHGEMLIERIATKRKLELSYKYLSQAQLRSILTAIAPVTFIVEYPDPQTGDLRTSTFYAGSKSQGMLRYKNNVPEWEGTKFNLIEV